MKLYFSIPALILFLTNSFLHLFWKKHSNLTKALIMPTVILCGYLTGGRPETVTLIAALFSWLGDILLEKNGFRWFTAGGLAFIVSHLCYGLSYIPDINAGAFNPYVLIPVCILYLAAAVSTVWNIRKSAPEKSSGLLLIYLLSNAFMNTLALMVMLGTKSVYGIIIYIGAVLFFISDNCLFYECFHPKKPNLFVPVMATYIFGEFMIVVGSALIK